MKIIITIIPTILQIHFYPFFGPLAIAERVIWFRPSVLLSFRLEVFSGLAH